jgi:hypothetical protein
MMQIPIFELTSRGLHPVRGTHRSGPIYGNVAIHPLLDRTLRAVSILSYNLCHQGILNELEKFMQRHAAAQFCCVSIKKSLLGGEVAYNNSLPDDPVSNKRRIVHTRSKCLPS